MDQWRKQLRQVVTRWKLSPEHQASIAEELEQHLEQEYAELAPRIGAAAALEQILVQVNDPALRTVSVRSRHQPPISVQLSRTPARGWSTLGRDVRYGWRSLRTSWGTTIMATLALALGIGLTTLMFTVLYGLLIRGLPFERADDIALVMEANAGQGETELQLSMHDFFRFRDAQKSFETFGAYVPVTVNIAGGDRPDRINATRMTAEALQIPKVKPLLGRSLRSSDEAPDSPLVVLLSYALWRDRYASDTAVIGRAVRINGIPATVIGVMPEGFAFPREPKLWLPLRLDPASVPWGTGTHVNGVGRLRAGATYLQANAELGTLAARIEVEHPESNQGIRTVVQPFIRATVPSRVYGLLYAMFGAVSLVFLVACANVANLLVARAAHRSKEVAVRVTLGASRLAIARQFLVEALLLCAMAAVLGGALAQAGLRVFQQAVAGELPFWADFRFHPQVFFFIALAALLASVVSGLFPALVAARSELTDVLKDQSAGSTSQRGGRLIRSLVVVELALSTTLLVVAALMTRSVINIRSLEPGFRTNGIITGSVTLALRDSAGRLAFLERVATEVARIPGVLATSLSTGLPGTGWREGRVAIEGKTYAGARSYPRTRQLAVTPGFFTAFDIPVLRGRPILASDRAGSLPVAVVNQRLIDRLFPDQDPIGRRVNVHAGDSVPRWVTIVGVVPNVYATDPGSVNEATPWPAELITAFWQDPGASASIAVHTNDDPAAVAAALRTAVALLDPDLPVYGLATMGDVLATARWDVRVFGALFVVFGVVALALASIGLYAVLAFSVNRREREMGIRMALGAATRTVMWLVLKNAAVLLMIGVTTGLCLGVGLARLASAVLFQVAPTDPAVLAVVVGTLGVTGLAACIVPALRATRADPVRSLRTE